MGIIDAFVRMSNISHNLYLLPCSYDCSVRSSTKSNSFTRVTRGSIPFYCTSLHFLLYCYDGKIGAKSIGTRKNLKKWKTQMSTCGRGPKKRRRKKGINLVEKGLQKAAFLEYVNRNGKPALRGRA